ncbi:GspE/PulE family protein [Burkholderia ambifaria]|uniref:GspE/PulE family protein n=1 Tax=Burkholderia ambifaria TaxID=152480 RepID=UPI001589D9E0|nr:ATPase, T2SS/T4P/T4SS family [Burkholderia ambifaria]
MSSSPTPPGKTPKSVTPLILSRAVKPIETDPSVTQGQPAAPAGPALAPVARPREPVLSAVAAAAAASVQPAQTASQSQPPGQALPLAAVARPLSDSGEFAASDEERKFLCLLDDGTLLVAEGHEMNPFVLSYCARLERLNCHYTTRLVTLDAIRRSYQGPRRDGSAERIDHTRMQVLAKNLIARACDERASDIHIRVNRFSTEILFRIHNELVRISEQTREYGERLLATLYAAMSSVSDNTYKPNERQDAAIGDRDKLPDRLFGVRIATAPTSVGSVMVLRLLYNDAGEATALTELGFTVAQANAFELLAQQPHGMNIISGPTGSGKSTTLQRVLTKQLREMAGSIHVITVEDPVEYPIEGAVQTPVVNAPTEEARSLAFAAAIANAMRLDPDTIMIGEVRDRASAQSALRAAMTGHQVWTTVHANGALAIVDRLVDLGLPIAMVTDESLVTGLISQRLAKLLCPHCSRPLAEVMAQLDMGLVARVKRAVGARFDAVRVAGPGCPHCKNGTVGRTVVAEVVRTDATFCELLRAGRKPDAQAYWLSELAGQTVAQHALEKVAAGLIDPRMAERVVGPFMPGSGGRPQPLGSGYGT